MGFKELAIATRAATCSNSNYSVAKITEILNTELCVPIPVKSYLDRDINNVNIPTSCTKIGACAFAGCQAITEIRIPASVTSIGENAFNFDLDQNRPILTERHIYCDFYKVDVSGYPWGAPLDRTTFHFLGLMRNPLTLTAEEANSTVKLNATGSPTTSGLQYRTSTDSEFIPYTVGTEIKLTNVGDYVQFCNTEETLSKDVSNYVKFVMTGKIAASGNIQSMLNGSASCSPYCYYYMFYDCTSLTKAPELPATTLASGCYMGMFKDCTSLTKAPEVLPATKLATDCYQAMFMGCTSLTQAPELPATELDYRCYGSMFKDCTSLTQAPALPATKLTVNCYAYMFYNCTSLTQAPDLPATELATNCYSYMFAGCSNLSYISVNFTEWHTNATTNWVSSVASSGEFIAPAELADERGDDRIPEGWLFDKPFVAQAAYAMYSDAFNPNGATEGAPYSGIVFTKEDVLYNGYNKYRATTEYSSIGDIFTIQAYLQYEIDGSGWCMYSDKFDDKIAHTGSKQIATSWILDNDKLSTIKVYEITQEQVDARYYVGAEDYTWQADGRGGIYVFNDRMIGKRGIPVYSTVYDCTPYGRSLLRGALYAESNTLILNRALANTTSSPDYEKSGTSYVGIYSSMSGSGAGIVSKYVNNDYSYVRVTDNGANVNADMSGDYYKSDEYFTLCMYHGTYLMQHIIDGLYYGITHTDDVGDYSYVWYDQNTKRWYQGHQSGIEQKYSCPDNLFDNRWMTTTPVIMDMHTLCAMPVYIYNKLLDDALLPDAPGGDGSSSPNSTKYALMFVGYSPSTYSFNANDGNNGWVLVDMGSTNAPRFRDMTAFAYNDRFDILGSWNKITVQTVNAT